MIGSIIQRMSESRNKLNRTYDLCLEAICAALITICSWISIQVFDVPFTLQTFAIFLVLMTIGGKRGTVSIIVYILLGLIGVPVFAGFKSGHAALLGPTGGFIVGFIFVGLAYMGLDKITKKYKTSNARKIVVGIIEGVLCEVVLYVFGVIWFMTIYTQNTGPVGLDAVMGLCVLPFLIPDAVKLVLAVITSIKTSLIVK